MNIIIAGAGKVGFNLAKTLSIGHNVTIIDINSQALDRIQEKLDILPLKGNVEDINTYRNFEGQEIDLFIAVTNIDNVNLVSTLVAGSVLQIKKKFVRLQNHFYDEKILKEKFAVDRTIFPLRITSHSISSLLKYPKANNVKFFKYTDLKLISVRVSKGVQPQVINGENFKIVGIERNKDFFIPITETEILPNDLVYFFGDENNIKEICQQLELENGNEIKRGVVFGGGKLGVAIAKSLLENEVSVKLIEEDSKQCEIADEELGGRASIINYKYNSHEIFDDESIKSADMFISATDNDEYNIIKCLEAKEVGIHKVLAIHNEMEYYNLMHALGIVVVRGPKMSAYNTIVEEISSTRVILQKSYCGAKAMIFMRKIFSFSKLIGKSINKIQIENSIFLLVRNNEILILNEDINLQEDDVIVVFASAKQANKVKTWIYEL